MTHLLVSKTAVGKYGTKLSVLLRREDLCLVVALVKYSVWCAVTASFKIQFFARPHTISLYFDERILSCEDPLHIPVVAGGGIPLLARPLNSSHDLIECF